MITLTKPNSTIISQGEDMFTIKHIVNRVHFVDGNNVIDRVKLGYMVKWAGGNHVVMKDDKLIIVERVEDAQIEEI